MAGQMPRAGDVIAGKYAIVRIIGEGGMGVVYEATHLRLRQRVAIKMLLPAMLEHEVIVKRFEREAHAAAGLKGRHAAHVFDVDVTADGLPYMVMEYLDGRDLQSEIESRGSLPTGEAVDYVLQACAAIAEAHALGIIHRDLKPSNLFLVRDGEARVVKLLDFGISKVQAESDKLTGTDVMMGTALYMSPEQIRASQDVDKRADIWALGVILYESLSGRAPFVGTATQVAAAIVTQDAPDIRSLCNVSPELAAIMQRAMQRDRTNRYSTVRELASALGPHAAPGTPGKVFADNLMSSSQRIQLPVGEGTGSYAAHVLGTGTGADNAATVLNAPGVSESRLRPRDGGTAPGWSQAGVSPRRGRAALFGFLGAFIFALTVALVIIVVRGRMPSGDATVAAAPPPPPVSVVSADKPPAPPTTTSEPTAEPSPPPVAVAPPPAIPVGRRTPVAPARGGPVTPPPPPKAAPPPPPPAQAPPPPPPPKPPPKPAGGSNPLTL